MYSYVLLLCCVNIVNVFAAVMITVQNSSTAQESYTPAVEVKVSAISCQCKNLIYLEHVHGVDNKYRQLDDVLNFSNVLV